MKKLIERLKNRGLKFYVISGIYFFMLFVAAIYMLYQTRYDREYFLSGDKFEYSDKSQMYESPCLALWKGIYVLEFDYTAKADVPFKIETDGVILDEILSSSENKHQSAIALNENTDVLKIIFEQGADKYININSVKISTLGELLYTDHIFYAIIILCLGIIIYLYFIGDLWLKSDKLHKTNVVLITIACLFTSSLFFSSKFPWGWDSTIHLARIEGMKDSMLLGQFPNYMLPKNLDGFGLFAALYPNFFMYPEALLRLCHVSLYLCYSIVIISAIFASAVSMYISVRHISENEFAAGISAILYVFAPYKMVDIFNRGAMGEVLALVFVPLVVAGLYEIFFGNARKFWYIAVIGYFGIINSHIISVFFVLVFSILFGIINVRRLFTQNRYLYLIKAFVFTVFGSLFFIATFFKFLNATCRGAYWDDILAYPTSWKILFGPVKWPEYGGQEGMIGLIGTFLIIISLVSIIRIFMKHIKLTDKDIFNLEILIISLLFIWFETESFNHVVLLHFPKLCDFLDQVQYPYRALVIGMPLLYMVGAYWMTRLELLKKQIFQVCAVSVAILWGGLSVTPFLIHWYDQERYSQNKLYGGCTTIGVWEYFPNGTDRYTASNDWIYPYSYEMQMPVYNKEGNQVVFEYKTTKEGDYVDFPIYYYEGFRAKVIGGDYPKGTKLKVEEGAEYRLRVYLPVSINGTAVEVTYIGPTIILVSYAISLVTMVIFGIVLYKERNKNED